MFKVVFNENYFGESRSLRPAFWSTEDIYFADPIRFSNLKYILLVPPILIQFQSKYKTSTELEDVHVHCINTLASQNFIYFSVWCTFKQILHDKMHTCRLNLSSLGSAENF